MALTRAIPREVMRLAQSPQPAALANRTCSGPDRDADRVGGMAGSRSLASAEHNLYTPSVASIDTPNDGFLPMSDDAGKLHIDSDWKAQAQAERQRLAEEAEKKKAAAAASGSGADGASSGGGMGQLPPATFDTLLQVTAQEALFALGAVADPRTGRTMMNLDVARFQIDMLAMLEEKTKGNLSEEESKTMATTLYELRQMYIAQANAQRENLRR